MPSDAPADHVDTAHKPPDLNRKIGVLIFFAIVAIVWIAKEVLYPIALAGLLALLVVPAVRFLERLRIPRIVASVLMVAVVSAVVGALTWFIGNQLGGIVKEMPSYQENIHKRIESLRGDKSGVLHIADSTLTNIKNEIAPDRQPQAGEKPPENSDTKEPTPVAVVQPHTMSAEDFLALSLTILQPVLTVGIVVIFAVFMLIQREDLHRRFLHLSKRLMNRTGNHLSSGALDEAIEKITRYLLMQSVTNISMGFAVGIGLYFLGVPHPFFWGLLTFLLRYVPYVGVLLAMLIVGFFTVAVSPTWNLTLLVMGMFVTAEIIMGNVIEPLFFGHGTGLSSFAIIIAATFWTWLWGPVGLFLSVPLTVCLVVLGRYVPSLDFLEIMLAEGEERAREDHADSDPVRPELPLSAQRSPSAIVDQ